MKYALFTSTRDCNPTLASQIVSPIKAPERTHLYYQTQNNIVTLLALLKTECPGQLHDQHSWPARTDTRIPFTPDINMYSVFGFLKI